MENCAHAVQRNTHTRPLPFADLRAAGLKKSLYVAPDNAGTNRIGEDGFKRRAMLSAQ